MDWTNQLLSDSLVLCLVVLTAAFVAFCVDVFGDDR